MDTPEIDLWTFHMQSKCSTTKLRPLVIDPCRKLKLLQPFINKKNLHICTKWGGTKKPRVPTFLQTIPFCGDAKIPNAGMWC